MTHEFKNIVSTCIEAKNSNIRSVLVTVVDLDGSSYRKPGVRMLVLENDKMVGAISGGCVEKEILRQAKSVFKTGRSKIFTYDGRYRLGCEGVIYILLELFNPDEVFINGFQDCITKRNPFTIHSKYKKEEGEFDGTGSYVDFGNMVCSVSKEVDKEGLLQSSNLLFNQIMKPCYKLIIFGTEHDAVQLCNYSSLTGWDTTIISGPSEARSLLDFPGATEFTATSPEELNLDDIDDQTAIVLMTHNFANDLRFLVKLKDSNPAYIGLLGPAARRDDLLSQFFEYCPDVTNEFMDKIHGPAGINIGSETPQEIAISVMAEILAVIRDQEPMFLSKKKGTIHGQKVSK